MKVQNARKATAWRVWPERNASRSLENCNRWIANLDAFSRFTSVFSVLCDEVCKRRKPTLVHGSIAV
jgi:hypothetical protein